MTDTNFIPNYLKSDNNQIDNLEASKEIQAMIVSSSKNEEAAYCSLFFTEKDGVKYSHRVVCYKGDIYLDSTSDNGSFIVTKEQYTLSNLIDASIAISGCYKVMTDLYVDKKYLSNNPKAALKILLDMVTKNTYSRTHTYATIFSHYDENNVQIFHRIVCYDGRVYIDSGLNSGALSTLEFYTRSDLGKATEIVEQCSHIVFTYEIPTKSLN